MATVSLKPGDTLNIMWSALHRTPFGTQEVESSFKFTYDELMARLCTKGGYNRSRRTGSEGARFSRVVALATNAIRKGKWSTGATINREKVFDSMISQYRNLDASEYPNITRNARKSLQNLCRDGAVLNARHRRELGIMMDALSLQR